MCLRFTSLQWQNRTELYFSRNWTFTVSHYVNKIKTFLTVTIWTSSCVRFLVFFGCFFLFLLNWSAILCPFPWVLDLRQWGLSKFHCTNVSHVFKFNGLMVSYRKNSFCCVFQMVCVCPSTDLKVNKKYLNNIKNMP